MVEVVDRRLMDGTQHRPATVRDLPRVAPQVIAARIIRRLLLARPVRAGLLLVVGVGIQVFWLLLLMTVHRLVLTSIVLVDLIMLRLLHGDAGRLLAVVLIVGRGRRELLRRVKCGVAGRLRLPELLIVT